MKKLLKNSEMRGFTLLEIMIALVILAGSILALLSAQGGSFMASERAERLTTATFLARQKMSEMQMETEKDLARNKFPQDDTEEKGDFDEPFDDYRWKYTVTKVEIPLQEAESEEGANAIVLSYVRSIMEQISEGVREIKLTVFWGDKDLPEEEQQSLGLVTHIVKL